MLYRIIEKRILGFHGYIYACVRACVCVCVCVCKFEAWNYVLELVLEYVKCLQVLFSPLLSNVSIAVIGDAHYKLRGDIHITCLALVSAMAPVRACCVC
jgi:hypothetical protein